MGVALLAKWWHQALLQAESNTEVNNKKHTWLLFKKRAANYGYLCWLIFLRWNSKAKQALDNPFPYADHQNQRGFWQTGIAFGGWGERVYFGISI